jgi:hypothetical protein
MLARLLNLASWRSGIRGLVVAGIDAADFALVVVAAVICLVVIGQL